MWPPESLTLPWMPEIPASRTGATLEDCCPVTLSLEATRAPTPPPRWMLHDMGRTFLEGGNTMSCASLPLLHILVFPVPGFISSYVSVCV